MVKLIGFTLLQNKGRYSQNSPFLNQLSWVCGGSFRYMYIYFLLFLENIIFFFFRVSNYTYIRSYLLVFYLISFSLIIFISLFVYVIFIIFCFPTVLHLKIFSFGTLQFILHSCFFFFFFFRFFFLTFN